MIHLFMTAMLRQIAASAREITLVVGTVFNFVKLR